MHAAAPGGFCGHNKVVLGIVGSRVAPMVTGFVGVIMFFMISGFYMSMIINERYAKLPVPTFYLSRTLRLYPVYAAVLLATVWFDYYATCRT